MYQWTSSLEEFLDHSNEDRVYAQFISRLIARIWARKFPTSTPTMRIVDIGCGPGTKAVKIARQLSARGIHSDWCLIDVDGNWTPRLSANSDVWGELKYAQCEVCCPIWPQRWFDDVEEKPDFALVIHVCYDDESETMAFELVTKLVEHGCIAFISAEHPLSDLNRIRRIAAQMGFGNFPTQRVASLERRLGERGFCVKQFHLKRKYLHIGAIPELDKERWFWNLLFGNKTDCAVSRELIELVDRISYRQSINSIGGRLLEIPDRLIEVRPRT